MNTNTKNKSSQSFVDKVKFIFAATVVIALGLAGLMANAHAAADVTPPDDVVNVTASPFDGSMLLTWDLALDDTEVAGYNIYYGTEPVTADSGEYTEFMDAGDVIEFVVPGLENGTTYYFAVTAYDTSAN